MNIEFIHVDNSVDNDFINVDKSMETLWITMWITVCPYMHDHARTMRAVCSGETHAAMAQRTHTERELNNIHMQEP